MVSSLQQQLAEARQATEVQEKEQVQQQATLETELADRQTALITLETQVAALTAAAEKLVETAKAEHQNQLKVLATEIATLKTTLAATEAEQVQIQQQLAAAQSQQTDLIHANRMLEQSWADAQVTITTLQAQMAALENQANSSTLATVAASTVPLEAQIDALTTDRDRLSQELQQATQSASNLDTQLQAAVQTQATLQQALEEATTTSAHHQTQWQQAQATVTTLEQAVQQLTDTNQALQAQLAAVPAPVVVTSSPPAQIAPVAPTETAVAVEPQAELESDESTAAELMEVSLAEPSTEIAAEIAAAEIVQATPQAPESVISAAQTAQPFAGKTVVITGRLKTLSPQQAEKLVTEAGGKVTKMPSSKTGFVVVGQNAGSKLKKAAKYNIPQLTEAEFLALLGMDAPKDAP